MQHRYGFASTGQFVSCAFVVLLRKNIPQRATYKLPLNLALGVKELLAMIEECPLPKHYIWYAKESNRAAEFLLKPNNEIINSASFAISIGLSFHAIELCGKAMLRSLGDFQNKISKEHGKHDLLRLLESVEQRLSVHSDAKAQGFKDFLLCEPLVNGNALGETIKSYLQTHLTPNKEARPRNYLYPDNETFIGPKLFSTIHVIAEHIIESATELCLILGHESP